MFGASALVASCGPDAEGIDGRAGVDEFADTVFVEISAHHDFGVLVSGFIEDGADLAGERVEIAAIQADSPHGASEFGGAARAFEGVVGVDQVDGGMAEGALEFAEGIHLAGEGHDPGVGGGAHHGDVVLESGEGVAGAGATADPGGARSEGAGFGGVGAARAELDDGSSGGGRGTARGFGGDQGLEGDGGEEISFRNLGFDDGGAYGEDGFAGEEKGAFGGGEEVAGETEIAQVVEEGRADAGELRESRGGSRFRRR